ncbi:hypothetical protein HYPGJ_31256 [Hyphomicrobium sp. GJ21]|nr:hypothetical protein HYPGJ_31256 [Hyphomicrobium sp. GJ21]
MNTRNMLCVFSAGGDLLLSGDKADSCAVSPYLPGRSCIPIFLTPQYPLSMVRAVDLP